MYSYVLASWSRLRGTWEETPMTSEREKSLCIWDGKRNSACSNCCLASSSVKIFMWEEERVNIRWSLIKNQRRFFLRQKRSLLPAESGSADACHLIPMQPNRFRALFKDEWSKTVMSTHLKVMGTCRHQRAHLLNEEYLCKRLIYILFLFSWHHFGDLFSC